MKKLLSFLSVVFGWLIWRWTGSILIGAIVAVVLFPLIGPIIEAFFTLIILLIKELILLFVPAQKVSVVTPREAGTDGKGVRILLGVKDFRASAQPDAAGRHGIYSRRGGTRTGGEQKLCLL